MKRLLSVLCRWWRAVLRQYHVDQSAAHLVRSDEHQKKARRLKAPGDKS